MVAGTVAGMVAWGPLAVPSAASGDPPSQLWVQRLHFFHLLQMQAGIPRQPTSLALQGNAPPPWAAEGMPPGAAPSGALDQTPSRFAQPGNQVLLGDTWLLPYQLSSFYQDFERNWGKKMWPNFVKNKMSLGVRYTLTVHICTSSKEMEYL